MRGCLGMAVKLVLLGAAALTGLIYLAVGRDGEVTPAVVAGVAQSQVQGFLRDPSSARFDLPSVTGLDERRWMVRGVVRSRNGLGVVVSSAYHVSLAQTCGAFLENGCWHISRLMIDGKSVAGDNRSGGQ